MATAISGLSKEQATLALSTQKLTQKQINQVLVEAKLLDSTVQLTTAQASERLSKSLNSKADSDLLLKKYALITGQKLEKNSTLEVSAAKLQEAVANGTLSATEATLIANAYGITIANGVQTASWKLLASAIWQNVKAMGAWLVSNPLGWLTLAVGAIAGLTAGFVYLSQSAERAKDKLEESAEAFSQAKSEVETLNSELQTTKQRIDELSAKENLTLVESGELDKLKETNKELERELRLRESIALEKGKQANKDAVDYFGSQSTYGTTAGNIDVSGDQLEILDYQLEKIKELEEYFKTADAENKDFLFIQNEKLLTFLKEETARTIEEFMKLDDSLMEGYDEGYLDRLDKLYQKYDEIANGVAQSHTDTIVGVLEKADFKSNKEQLLDLGESGSLSVETLSSKFPELIEYLNNAGVSAQELYQYIMALANPDAVKYDELKHQLQDVLGFGSGINTLWAVDMDKKLSDLGLYNEDALEVFATIKAKYVNGETESWTPEDWIANIQEGLEQIQPVNETSGLFGQLNNSKDAIDSFTSSVQSAYDAYSNLMNPNISSSDMLSSVMSITKAVSEMGGSLNWEFIEKQTNSVELLGNTIEYLSEKYAKSILSGAGIDVDSKFGQMLANNIIQAQKASTQLENVNTQIDGLQSAYKSLTDIVDTYNETGYITFDHLQTLLELEPQYLSCLVDENGQLQLNQQSMLALAEQRLNDAEAQAVQQAITELGQLTLQDEKTAVEENGQAFQNQVSKLASYNAELANTIAYASVGASSIRDLNAAITGAETKGASDDQINTVLSNLETKLQMIGNVRNNIGNNFGKIMGEAGKNSADAYLESFEKELKELQGLRDNGEISEKEYLDRLRALYTRYFKDRKKYLDEFRKYEQEYLSGMKSLHDSALSGISKLMSAKIDGYQESKEIAIESLEAEKEAAEEAYQAQIDAIDNKIKALEKQKKANQDIIDGLNDEIDKIREANDERDRQLTLQQKQMQMQQMLNQKTTLQYSDDKGMHYVQNLDGIRQAKTELEDAQDEIRIAEIEKQIKVYEKANDKIDDTIDSLNEQKDALKEMQEASSEFYEKLIKQQEKYYDSLIKSAEKQKSDWESIGQIQEIAEAYSAIEQVFGDLGYTVEDVLNGSSGAFEDFKAKYISLINDMNSNSSFAEGLSYATGIAEENLGSFLDKTKEVADGLNSLGTDTEGLNNLTTKIGDVTSAVGEAANAISGASGGTTTNTSSDQGEATATGGATSLKSAVEDQTTDAIAKLDEQIQKFSGEEESLVSAVQQVITKVVGSGEEQEGDEPDATNLKGAIQSQYKVAEEVLPQEKTLFEELLVSIEACVTKLNEMVEAISSMGELNVGGSGSNFSYGISGGGGVNGNANVNGNAFARGSWGAKHSGETLVGELGQELVVDPDTGTWRTVGDNGAEFTDIERGDIVFNHKQTEAILKHGKVAGRGKAYANGTTPSYLRPLQEGDNGYALMKSFEVYQDMLKTQIVPPIKSIDNNMDMIARNISNVNTNNNQRSIEINMGDIVCKGVTAQDVASEFSSALKRELGGMYQSASQIVHTTR